MIVARFIFSVLLAAFCSGCGTITNHPDETSTFYPRRTAYGGVKMDWEMGTSNQLGCGPWWFLDMPFSAVFDTLCLPSDLYTTHKWNHDLNAYQESLKRNPPDPNPLAAWKHTPDVQPDPAIVADYETYIEQLPQDQKKVLIVNPYMVRLFWDEKGAHAVEIRLYLKHTEWKYVLIYDESNRRVKVLKYAGGHLVP
jgi:uncharacterized protein YceK